MQRKLLELKRKLFMVMGIMLCFICFTGITVNAAELNAETLGDSEETVISAEERERSVFLDSSKERIPNFFVVEAVVEGSSGSDKIKIIAHNIGIDTIDKISCKVKITDNKGLVQYNKVVSFTDVTPLFCKRSILSTLTNVRPLTWPVAMTSAVYGAYPEASVTMEVNLPKMTCRSDPCISEAL